MVSSQRWYDSRAKCAARVVLAAALAAACRNETPGADGRTTIATSGGAATAPLPGERARAAPSDKGATGVASSVATPERGGAPSGRESVDGSTCGGPPPLGAPLPRSEERRSVADRAGYYRFELKFPLVHLGDEGAAQQLNRRLAELVGAKQKRFVQASLGGDVPDPENARWFEGKCEVAYQSAAFVSVACDTMEGPGAHPNLDKFAYNFQVCPEVRLLALGDLCRAQPECRKTIVDLINADFRTGPKKETGIQFRAGTSGAGEPSDSEHPTAKLEAFGITKTGLRFYLFDELPHVLQAFAVVDLPAAQVRPALRPQIALQLWPPE